MGAHVPPRHRLAKDRGRSRRSHKHGRYHLHIAAQAEPSVRDKHRAAAGAPVQPSDARLRDMENVIALSPIYTEGLKAIPGWDQQPGRKANDEARWHQRLAEPKDYMAAGNDWPPQERPTTSKNGPWASGYTPNG